MYTLSAITWFNRTAFVVLAAGTVYLFAREQSTAALLLALALAVMAFSVSRSVRGLAGDNERVNAAQPFDERDSVAMRNGFAAVGQFAFIAQGAVVIWHIGRPGQTGLLAEVVKIVALSVALGVGNWVALRRS
ncbi:MAG: hypothetical protein ABR500_12430 [Dermatophilaceae bacterium]